MQGFLRFFSFIAVFVVGLSNSIDTHLDTIVVQRFKNWIEVHNIQVNDDNHLSHMFDNWLSNDKYIQETNAKNLTWIVGHNAYSGMNSEEFSEFMSFRKNQDLLSKGTTFLRGSVPTVKQSNLDSSTLLPTSVDWRQKGVVSSVRDQGSCGSCWSFSGTATIESATAIKTGHLYDLSEQQSVSCAGLKYGNLGCGGGYYSGLWDFSKNNNGICSESSYPYTSGTTGATGSCLTTCTPITGTKVTNYVDVTPNSDSSMMTALSVEPVSIAIEADTRSFQLYSKNIYSDYEGCNKNSGTKGPNSLPNIDHAVVLVGYGSENGQDYYILRNSWSSSWGENGYMRIARGSQYGPYGMCGVLYDPMYPIV